jgi:heme-degrading monooxygenase HmoA
VPGPGADGPIVTVFRSRLRSDAGPGYERLAAAMLERARSQPGFVDFKSFSAPDGERVSIVTFSSREAHDAWRDDAAHRRAQDRGRTDFYAEYQIQVCEVVERRSFPS